MTACPHRSDHGWCLLLAADERREIEACRCEERREDCPLTEGNWPAKARLRMAGGVLEARR